MIEERERERERERESLIVQLLDLKFEKNFCLFLRVLAVNQVLQALGVKMECQVFRDNQDKRGQEVKMDQR